MSDKTKIEWADATVNAINGCSVISPGCKNCYAMKQAHRFEARRGLTMKTAGGMVWTGEVRLNEKALYQPLNWKKPRRIFWNAHGDTFHEKVPDEWIDMVFAVCAMTPQHTHMILTKRPERMREYVNGFTCDGSRRFHVADAAGNMMEQGDITHITVSNGVLWPLPNVWLGTSVEDQMRKFRIDELRQIPAAVRFLSLEPLLEDLGKIDLSGIHWVIVGGESGQKAREMKPEWEEPIRLQCASADVPYLRKQWGEFLNGIRVGKKAAGNLLAGKQHMEFPGDATLT